MLTLKVGHLVIEAPTAAVVTVDSAQVALDDDDVPVVPGSHVVEARRGGETASATTQVAAGNSARVRLSFSDKPRTPPPSPPSESKLTSRLRNGAYALGFALVASALLVFGSLQRRRRRPRRGRSRAMRDPE